jgi:hypothetical protein
VIFWSFLDPAGELWSFGPTEDRSVICHVCRREASGQCKTCGKFYCPDHGDVVCVNCATISPATQEQREGLAKAGPACYLCAQPAVGACSKCGKFYCSQHASNSTFWTGRAYCADCYDNFMGLYAFQVTIGLTLLGLLALLVFARGCG